MTPHEILEKMRGAKILVIGDPIRDDYVFGRVERICPEAPVPVFIPDREESRPGGASNVAHQLNALGCATYTFFPQNVSVKTRYMAGTHLVLRVDEDSKYGHAQSTDVDQAERLIKGLLPKAIVLSDYNKGWLTDHMASTACSVARHLKIPTIVDPKNDWFKYRGCSLLCPNEKEYLAQGDYAAERWAGKILLKRGEKGMSLFQGDDSDCWHDIPATARHVYDVTGAGDTVVAVVAAAIAVGATYLEAARLAALAAGWVVGEVGTAVCTNDKLKELVDGR